MAAIAVFVDDRLAALARTEDLEVLAVNMGGTKVDEAVGSLDFSGGVYPADGESKHLIWLSDLVITPGQRIKVLFAEAGQPTHSGKAIDELFPNTDADESEDEPNREQMLKDIQTRKRLREQISLTICSSSGAEAHANLSHAEHGFGMTVLWNWKHPEKVSASLHTYTLEQLRSGQDLSYHFREMLQPGSWVEARIE